MKKQALLASVLALATSFAIGCAAPTADEPNDASSDSPSGESATVVSNGEATPPVDAPIDPELAAAFVDPDSAFWGRTDAANLILGVLMSHGSDLLLNQVGLGDRTAEQLEKILSRLDDIERQVLETKNELNTSIARAQMDNKIQSIYSLSSTIEETLRRYKKIGGLEKAKNAALASGDELRAADLNLEQEAAVREFVRMFDAGGRMVIALGDLHKMITSMDAGDQGVIQLFRWNMRNTGRFVTHQHSTSLRAGYKIFEDLQAVAVLLRAECNAATQYGAEGSGKWKTVTSSTCSIDQRDNGVLANDFRTMIARQHAMLPAVIPQNVVIDLGPSYASPDNDTANKLMFVTVNGRYTWKPGDSANTPGTAPFALAQIVDNQGGGAYRAPTRAELAPMFASINAEDRTTAQHLNRVFRTEGRFVNQGFIWTSDTVKVSVVYNYSCLTTGCFTSTTDVTTHSGFHVVDAVTHHQRFPWMVGNRDWKTLVRARAEFDAEWARTPGGVIGVRNTGNRIYM